MTFKATIYPPSPPTNTSTLLSVIENATSDARVQLAMAMGALLEGGSWDGPWSAGDNGTSFGPFQIHLPAHPNVTAAQASDPSFAVSYMLPEYQMAVASIPQEQWQQNPLQAAQTAVQLAERPAQPYTATEGVAKVTDAYQRALTAIGSSLQDVQETLAQAGTSVLYTAEQWAGLCQAWVEQQLLGSTGHYASPAALIASGQYTPTSDPTSIPIGTEVIFSPGGATGPYGHAGIALGGGMMESVWSNGQVVKESIAQFEKDNDVSLAGYSTLGGQAKLPTNAGTTAQTSAQQAQTAGDITIPLNIGPWSGQIDLPNPLNPIKTALKDAERLFWLVVGVIVVALGLWVLVKERELSDAER